MSRNMSEMVGKRIVINAEISVPYTPRRKTQAIQNMVIKRTGEPVDHMWIRQDQNPWYTNKMGEEKRGDKISIRGVVYSYTKRNGQVNYSIGDIDAYTVNGKGHIRGN